MGSKNKILITIFFLVFIFGNLAIITLNALSISSREVKEYVINVYEENSAEPKSTSVSEFAFSDFNFTQQSEDLNIYALAGTKYTVNESEVELIAGTLFIQGDNLSIKFRNQVIELQNSFSILVNENDGVVITSGQPTLNNEFLNINNQILFSAIEKVSNFSRDKLNEDPYSELTNFLVSIGANDTYFSDFDGPELISISPRNNFTTIDSNVRFYGYTEPQASVMFEGKELVVDDKGYFTTQIDLNVGDNKFEISLKDKFGNETIEEINYIRRENRPLGGTTPTSFPI